jgi:hypothetical protein
MLSKALLRSKKIPIAFSPLSTESMTELMKSMLAIITESIWSKAMLFLIAQTMGFKKIY